MLYISVANGMRFAKAEAAGTPPNFENTLSGDEKFASVGLLKCYHQKWQDDSVVKVQAGSDSAVVPTIQPYQPEAATPITATLINSYTTDANPANWRYYYEFSVDFSNYTDKVIQVKVTQNTDVLLSEFQEGLDLDEDIANGNMMVFNNTNSAQPTDYTNYQIDYTTGIQFFFYAESILMDYEPQVEEEVLDNIDTKVLLESSIYRGLLLKTDFLPRFMMEKFTVAGKHFYFVANSLQYVTSGAPKVTPNGSWGSIEWLLIQKDTTGFNTDNIGDDGVMTIPLRNFTADAIVVIPAGYFIHAFSCNHETGSAGAYTLKAGYTLGSDDLFSAFGNIVGAPTLTENHVAAVHKQKSFDTPTNIYVTYVSGTGTGKIGIQISKNAL